jgi:hypothetical protein
MASAADIAALMVAGMAPPAGNSDIGFHQGVVQSWDELTGVNTVLVNGTSRSNLKCLSIGAGISLTAGDTVGLLRFQSTTSFSAGLRPPGLGQRSVSARHTSPLERGHRARRMWISRLWARS